MSSIQRRIVTIFEARGAGQVRAALGQMRSGMGGMSRDLRETRGEASLLDKQLRAMGTTLRYAFAGGLLFGGINVVGQLNQIQQQLGLISAISPTAFRGVALSGDVLQRFGEQAEDAAFRSNTTVTEFNEGLVNLVSTVQNVPQNEVVPMLEQIAQTAKLSLTPVDEATKGITGLLVAFGKPATLKNVQQYLAEYQRLIFTVPGGAAAGPQIIQQLPQLAAVSRLSNVNPEQMFGLLNTVLRAGGSPATSARGLQYLIQGLAQPPSDQSRKALASIGITPDFTQREGGVAALFKLIQAIRSRGVNFTAGRKATAGLSDELLDQLEGTEGADQLGGLGISGAGAEFARLAVGRIHGVRSLVLLASQNDQAVKDLRAMTELGKNHAQQVRELHDAWKRFEDQAQLQKASLAIQQMALDVAQIFEPVLNFGAGQIVGLRNVVDANTEAATAGAAGLLGLMALARRRGLKGIPRLGGTVGGVVAGTAALEHGTGGELGASPLNPMYVTVVNQLFGGRSRPAPPVPVGGPPPARTPGRLGRLGRLGRGLGGAGAALVGTAAAYETYNALDPFDFNQRAQMHKSTKLFDWLTSRHGGVTIPLGGLFGGGPTIGGGTPDLSPAQQKIIDRVKKGYLSEVNADRMLRRISTMDQLRQAGINVKGKAEVTVHVVQPDGKKQRTKVIMDFVPDFTQTAPQMRGQNTTRRGG